MAVEALQRPNETWTATRWFALPIERRTFEIIEGEAVVAPMPNTAHSRAQMALAVTLDPHIRANHLGEFFASLTVVFSDKNLAVPDLFFVANDRLHLLDDRCLRGAPTLAIEILSPSNQPDDRVRKFHQYAHFGVEWYWLVDPLTRNIEVFQLKSGAFARVAQFGSQPLGLPPFETLILQPADIWR